jgi:hypothetical protein
MQPPPSRPVRLPRTATRPKAYSAGLLIQRLEPHPTSALDFFGRLLAPGEQIAESDLWPTEHWPAIPVYLETCQLQFSGRGHHRNPYERILWIYELRRAEWRQVAHVSALTPEEWIPVLAPVAQRFLTPRTAPPAPDVNGAATRIAALVETELLALPERSSRALLLQHAWDYLALRRADIGTSRKTYQLPLRSPKDDPAAELLLPGLQDQSGWSPKDLGDPGTRVRVF